MLLLTVLVKKSLLPFSAASAHFLQTIALALSHATNAFFLRLRHDALLAEATVHEAVLSLKGMTASVCCSRRASYRVLASTIGRREATKQGG